MTLAPQKDLRSLPRIARSLLYDLFDCLGLDKEAEAGGGGPKPELIARIPTAVASGVWRP